MIIETGRFGQLTVGEADTITIPQGLLGFPQWTKFCLVDSADDTFIFWLQSLEHPEVCFPTLEPKIFKPDYVVKLSGFELRELKLESLNQAAVLSVLTIPENVTEMTANLRAPVVLNLKEKIAKQVVLQENEYSVKQSMFKELRAHLVTLSSQKQRPSLSFESTPETLSLQSLSPSLTVQTLAQ